MHRRYTRALFNIQFVVVTLAYDLNRNEVESKEAHTDHLKEGEVAVEDVVEVDLGVVPGVVKVIQRLTLVARRHDVVRHGEAGRVDAVLEAAAEQVDAHDAEDEPED